MLFNHPLFYQRMLNVSNGALLLTTMLLGLSVLISYPYAHYFSLFEQVAAHISTIVLSAFLKLSYVCRCLAQYQLGVEVR